MAIDHHPAAAPGELRGQPTPVNDSDSPATHARPPYLSKSQYLQGLQCHKLLWHAINAMNLIPSPDESAQALFDQGAEVGALARTLFSTGVEIGPGSIQTRLEATREALALRVPIFEATFMSHGGYAQVDILEPTGGDQWDIIEVKSSTGVDDVHLADVAFQYFVLTSAGIHVRRCAVMVVNNRYVRHGAVETMRRDRRSFGALACGWHSSAGNAPRNATAGQPREGDWAALRRSLYVRAA